MRSRHLRLFLIFLLMASAVACYPTEADMESVSGIRVTFPLSGLGTSVGEEAIRSWMSWLNRRGGGSPLERPVFQLDQVSQQFYLALRLRSGEGGGNPAMDSESQVTLKKSVDGAIAAVEITINVSGCETSCVLGATLFLAEELNTVRTFDGETSLTVPGQDAVNLAVTLQETGAILCQPTSQPSDEWVMTVLDVAESVRFLPVHQVTTNQGSEFRLDNIPVNREMAVQLKKSATGAFDDAAVATVRLGRAGETVSIDFEP